jgi:hypothetical protein
MTLRFLIPLLFVLPGNAVAQDYLYVSTNNLILRDRPESTYVVLDILHAGSKLKRDSSDKGYLKDKQVTTRFYQVELNYQNEEGHSVYTHGWVEKKYVVPNIKMVTAPDADTTLDLIHSPVPLIKYGGDGPDPNGKNYLLYPYPKYKGGEKVFPGEEKRVYHSGPRGGCYYLDKRGRKVYVDRKYCK